MNFEVRDHCRLVTESEGKHASDKVKCKDYMDYTNYFNDPDYIIDSFCILSF